MQNVGIFFFEISCRSDYDDAVLHLQLTKFSTEREKCQTYTKITRETKTQCALSLHNINNITLDVKPFHTHLRRIRER